MFENIEQTAVFIRDSIREIPDRYNSNRIELQKNRQEELDLLHLIELTNMNARDGFKVYKELQKVLQRRRSLKDENDLLEPLANVVRKAKGQLTEYDKVIGEIRKQKKVKEKRSYKCKVRADLQEKF